MADRPYVLLKCAMSLDGYLDDASGQRLLLSSIRTMERLLPVWLLDIDGVISAVADKPDRSG